MNYNDLIKRIRPLACSNAPLPRSRSKLSIQGALQQGVNKLMLLYDKI